MYTNNRQGYTGEMKQQREEQIESARQNLAQHINRLNRSP
jgi:hypothetical protein